MTLEAKMNVLKLHSVHCEMINNKLIADSMYTLNGELHIEKEDATNWTKKELYDFLGY